jgi:hypothetical protein
LRRRNISYAVQTAINTRTRKGREGEGEIVREAGQVEDIQKVVKKEQEHQIKPN